MVAELNLHNVASLTSLVGKGFVRHADGTRSELVAGMKLSIGDVVVTLPGAKATVQIDDGRSFELIQAQGDAIKIDKTVLDVLSDVQEVKVVDLSALYSVVAHHITADPAIDPLAPLDDQSTNVVGQESFENTEDEPAALGDTGGGDLLSGNTYVVLHGNPIATDTNPFPTGINNGFNPSVTTPFHSSPSPLAYLIGLEPPSSSPNTLVMTLSTSLNGGNGASLIDTHDPSNPVVDDEAGALIYTLSTTRDSVPQSFTVQYSYDGGQHWVDLEDDAQAIVEVSPNSGQLNTFAIPVSEGQEGLHVDVRLLPIHTEMHFNPSELSSTFTVGELGSETDLVGVTPTLNVSFDLVDINYSESDGNEGTATFQIHLTDDSGNPVTLKDPLAFHYLLENNDPQYQALHDGLITVSADGDTFLVPIPEEMAEDFGNPDDGLDHYTLGLSLPNDVKIYDSEGSLLSLNPIEGDGIPPALGGDLSNLPNEFLAAAQTDLQVLNDAINEAGSGSPGAEEGVYVYLDPSFDPSIDKLDDDDAQLNPPINVAINSDLLPTTDLHHLDFDINVYSGDVLLGSLAHLNAALDGVLNGNQLSFQTPIDLTKVVDLGGNLVDESVFEGQTLTFKLEAASDGATSLFQSTNFDSTNYAVVVAQVIDDSSWEELSVKSLEVDPSYVDFGNHLISRDEVLDPNATQDASGPPLYDSLVMFTVNFEQHFGDANFNVLLDGQVVAQLNLGANNAYATPVYDDLGNIISYQSTELASGSAADGMLVDYTLNTDGTSSATFYVALPNTEAGTPNNISLALADNNDGTGPVAYDLAGNLYESVDTSMAVAGPYVLDPTVHVTASIDGVTDQDGTLAIDDEAPLAVTLQLDHAVNGSTQFGVEIVATDLNGNEIIVYSGSQTVDAGTLSQSFYIDQSLLTHTLEEVEGLQLSVRLTDQTADAVYFTDATLSQDAVVINAINNPDYLVSVQELSLANDPIQITVTPPSTYIDDEDPNNSEISFSCEVQGEYLPADLGQVQFYIYTQAINPLTGELEGDKVLLGIDPITIDLAQAGVGNFSFTQSFTLPLALLGDGHQEVLLAPVDSSLAIDFSITSTPFDVIDMSYQVVHSQNSGIDTYVFLDSSDGTSTTVTEPTGNHIEAFDVIRPLDDTTTFELNFGDQVRAGGSSDFLPVSWSGNSIHGIIYDHTSAGHIAFKNAEGLAMVIDANNVQEAIDYLAHNIDPTKVGATVEFTVDNNGQHDTYVFHQSQGGFSIVNIADTAPEVSGIDTTSFSTTKVHIVDNH